MKFPVSALFFVITSFIFFICWVVTTFIVNAFHDALQPLGSSLSAARQASFNDIMVTLPWAFGFLCALFFIVGIILVFVLESWSDEPEFYYRQ
jgi:hypothetical protein